MKKPKPTESKEPQTSACPSPCERCSLRRCSSQAPSTNSTMPRAAVYNERVPLKKPWFTAPEMKLMPEYLSSIVAWCF